MTADERHKRFEPWVGEFGALDDQMLDAGLRPEDLAVRASERCAMLTARAA